MVKFQLDLAKVADMLDPNKIPMKGNESKLIRVAFDLFRVDGDEADDLWQLQADDDGNEFLVRTYSLPEEKVAEASVWSVLADKKYANLTVSFNGVPLTRLASKDYGAENPHDGKSLQGVVFRKLSSDGEFVFKLLADLPREKRMALRQAGLIDDLKNWLQSKDITGPIIEKITALVEETVPEYEEKESEEENEQDDEDFSAEDFSAEEIKNMLEKSGGIVAFRPSMYGFSYLVSYPNGYNLSIIPYGEGINFTVREKPEEGSWDLLEGRIKNKSGDLVDPNILGFKSPGDGIFIFQVTDIPKLKKINDMANEEKLSLEKEQKKPWDKVKSLFGLATDNDEWKFAFLGLQFVKHAKEAPFVGPIEQQTEKNKYFRKVLFTGEHSQLVLMSLNPGEELGSEVHEKVDQFFRIEEGEATFVLDGKKKHVKTGGAVVIPSGTEHNVINSSKTEPLKLYTIYSPPNHPPGTIQKTKEEAEAAEKKEQKADDQWKLAFLDLHLKTAHCGHCGQDADERSYREVFDNLLESFKAKYNITSLDELSDKAKKELFDEIDTRWTSKKESKASRISALGIPRVAPVPESERFKEIKTLAPSDQEALEFYLKSMEAKTNG